MIVNAGIKEVYFTADYPDDLTLTILKEGGISYIKWDVPMPEGHHLLRR
jgi:deoxycytidylate deaminase